MKPSYCAYCGAALIILNDNLEQLFNRKDWPRRVEHTCDPRDVKLVDRMLKRESPMSETTDSHQAERSAVHSGGETMTPEQEVDNLLREFQRACDAVVVQGDSNLSETTKLRAILRNDLRARLLSPSSTTATPLNATNDLAELFNMIARRDPSVTAELFDTREFGERAARIYAALGESDVGLFLRFGRCSSQCATNRNVGVRGCTCGFVEAMNRVCATAPVALPSSRALSEEDLRHVERARQIVVFDEWLHGYEAKHLLAIIDRLTGAPTGT